MTTSRDDFTVVLKRLDHVDETLASLTKFIHHVAAQPPAGGSLHNVPSWPSSNQIPGLPPSSEPLNFDQPDSPAPAGPSTSENPAFETAESDEGERVYGYPAPLVLVKALLRQASGPLLGSDEHDDNQGRDGETAYTTRALHDSYVRVTFQKKLDEFPFQSRRPEPPVLGDTNPVTTPPRLLANLFIPGYLKNINPRTPIFDEAELQSAIEAHYSEEHSPRDNTAWALIINNIVLLELGLEIQATRASPSNSRGMNDDILPSFLKNCDRAIANLAAFSTPSLVNVQALITLVCILGPIPRTPSRPRLFVASYADFCRCLWHETSTVTRWPREYAKQPAMPARFWASTALNLNHGGKEANTMHRVRFDNGSFRYYTRWINSVSS